MKNFKHFLATVCLNIFNSEMQRMMAVVCQDATNDAYLSLLYTICLLRGSIREIFQNFKNEF